MKRPTDSPTSCMRPGKRLRRCSTSSSGAHWQHAEEELVNAAAEQRMITETRLRRMLCIGEAG